jgi:phospholipid-binding lipoprotein MlaA
MRINEFNLGHCVIIMLVVLLASCSTLPQKGPETEPPMRQYKDLVKEKKEYAVEVSDPLEGFNRGVYRFNYYFDKYLFLPVVKGYAWITPDFLEDGITNFFKNLREITNLTNSILQFKGKSMAKTTGRIVINTTLGIGGLFDPATHFGIHRVDEDFGQTLGFYGVGHGPYLVLPILGPSNLRDTTGLVVDTVVYTVMINELVDQADMKNNEEDLLKNGLTVLSAIDTRHRTPFRYYGTGSPFEYDLVRMLYTLQREFLIAE